MIVIVNGTTKDKIKRCIDSIKKDIISGYGIIIIDSGVDNNEDYFNDLSDMVYLNVPSGMKASSSINMVISECDIDDDIILIDEAFSVMPRCIENMLKVAEVTGAGIVGAVSNVFANQQAIDTGDEDFNTYIERKIKADLVESVNDLFAFPEIVLIRKDTWNKNGVFDDNFNSLCDSMKDFCIRAICNDIQIRICKNAFAFAMNPLSEKLFFRKPDRVALEDKYGRLYANSEWGISNAQEELLSFIYNDNRDEMAVLDVGCDCGHRLIHIKNKVRNAKLYGCDINEAAVNFANHFSIAKCENIEDLKLDFDGVKFDYIICGDVLEHLRNPKAALDYLRGMLKDNGYLIASIPNLMHISVIKDLLDGNFTYTETGLLDKTHIHLFTYNEIVRMFLDCGYRIDTIESRVLYGTEKDSELIDKLLILSDSAQKHMYTTFQYLVKAKA